MIDGSTLKHSQASLTAVPVVVINSNAIATSGGGAVPVPLPIDGGNPTAVVTSISHIVPIQGVAPVMVPVQVTNLTGAALEVKTSLMGNSLLVHGNPAGTPVFVAPAVGPPTPRWSIDGGNSTAVAIDVLAGVKIPIQGGNTLPVSIDGGNPLPVNVAAFIPFPIEGNNALPVNVAAAIPIPIEGGNAIPVNVAAVLPIPIEGGNVLPVAVTGTFALTPDNVWTDRDNTIWSIQSAAPGTQLRPCNTPAGYITVGIEACFQIGRVGLPGDIFFQARGSFSNGGSNAWQNEPMALGPPVSLYSLWQPTHAALFYHVSLPIFPRNWPRMTQIGVAYWGGLAPLDGSNYWTFRPIWLVRTTAGVVT